MEIEFVITNLIMLTDTIIIIITGIIIEMVITQVLISMQIITGRVTITGKTRLSLHEAQQTGITIETVMLLVAGDAVRQLILPGLEIITEMQKRTDG